MSEKLTKWKLPLIFKKTTAAQFDMPENVDLFAHTSNKQRRMKLKAHAYKRKQLHNKKTSKARYISMSTQLSIHKHF